MSISQNHLENGRDYILVFDTNEERRAVKEPASGDWEEAAYKKIWAYLSPKAIKLDRAVDEDELYRKARKALAVVVLLDNVENDFSIASSLSADPGIVCNIIALVRDCDAGQRGMILAKGYDAVYDAELVDGPFLGQILNHLAAKGRALSQVRALSDEYNTIDAALSASAAAFIVFDENRKLVYVSEHYLKAYPAWGHRLVKGLDVMEAFGIFCEEENFTPENPHYELLRGFWDRLEGEEDFYALDKRIFRLRARDLPNGKGTIVITTNITRHVRQETALTNKSKALQKALYKEKEAVEIQRQFINMISHEFRTPLSIVDGHAQAVQRRADSIQRDDLLHRTRVIRSAVSRLVTLMEGVLSSNLLKTGALELVLEGFDLKTLIVDLCENHEMLARDTKIETTFHLKQGELHLDKKVVTLVFSNLLSNAIKFTPNGEKVSVRIVETVDREGRAAIEICVEDYGIGIPANELDKIFGRYYRATTSSGIPGTGIGLNLVKDLVALHQGYIDVESQEGKGSRFTVILPLEACCDTDKAS